MLRRAAFLAGTHLARLAADIPAFAHDRHAPLRRADRTGGATVATTFTSGRATAILRANAPLPAAVIVALVLRWAAHVVDAAGSFIATCGPADGRQRTAHAGVATCSRATAGFSARLLRRTALTIDAVFPCRAARAIADAIFVAAAIRQAALIVPAAAATADQRIRATRIIETGRTGGTAGIAAGVGLGAA